MPKSESRPETAPAGNAAARPETPPAGNEARPETAENTVVTLLKGIVALRKVVGDPEHITASDGRRISKAGYILLAAIISLPHVVTWNKQSIQEEENEAMRENVAALCALSAADHHANVCAQPRKKEVSWWRRAVLFGVDSESLLAGGEGSRPPGNAPTEIATGAAR